MKKVLVGIILVGLLNAAPAMACDIENKRVIRVGVSEGVAGECSNTGGTIQCLKEGEEEDWLSCNGPEGSFSGSNLQDLIHSACGCAAVSDDGATEQLRQELGD